MLIDGASSMPLDSPRAFITVDDASFDTFISVGDRLASDALK
jgi:hypothetical protein